MPFFDHGYVNRKKLKFYFILKKIEILFFLNDILFYFEKNWNSILFWKKLIFYFILKKIEILFYFVT
jgi:hypothetical protein